MFRLIGAAALALAATNPAFAQGKSDDNPGKGGGKPDHAGMDHGKHEARDRGRSDDRSARSDERGRGNDRADRDDTPQRDRRGNAGRAGDAVIRADFRDGDRDRRDSDWTARDGSDRWDGRDGWIDRERFYASVPACPPGLAKKNNGCLPPGIARQERDEAFGYIYRPALFGIPLRAAADYVYYDGYLIPSGGTTSRYVPLLGGALAVGQIWPEAYPSMPLNDWQRDYYGFDEPDGYRYADNVLYDVDPATSAIEAVVALVTGSDFAVGQQLPAGYDIYNVPAPYQDRYADSEESLYRYADGRVYEVDPVSMLIERAIDLVV